MSVEVLPGRSYPLGATVETDGINFSIFSQHCTKMELLLFDHPDAIRPAHVVDLSPITNRTFYYWHAFIPGLRAGQAYAFRAHGPYDPIHGHRFDSQKVLLDPYAKAIADRLYDRSAAKRRGDNCARSMRCIVVDTSTYDWEGDLPPRRSHLRDVVYEMHVAGFTRHPNSGVAANKRGTYAGLIEKIPYLRDLGVNTVELLPVQQFDRADAPAGQINYWGYSPVAYFAPHNAYSSRPDPLGAVDEFRDMVKAFHRAGIAVVLDVVFNHTSEGDETGPTLSFRGLENVAYYIPGSDPGSYANYSGCGNTINANHSIVRRMIMDCLRYWVLDMHVDGFRFDLASALSRGEFGEPLRSPPLLWEIESDPVLAGSVIIAEAWDAGGLYQVGSFIGDRFAELNGRYRDDVRSFVRSEPGTNLPMSLRVVGSPDVYPHIDRNIRRTVNFVTSHDGFTLNDLVSYNHKHNEANGEQSRDGANDNRSWNCGFEGPSDDPAIEALRERQIKNFYTILFMSQGTPMISMGDELRRSQSGNNNAYCHDNELSWFDWDAVQQHAAMLRFVRELVRFHNQLDSLHVTHYLPVGGHPSEPFVSFHGVESGRPDWSHDSRSLAFSLCHPLTGEQIYAIFNAYWEPLKFQLPRLPAGQEWRRVIDTALPSPQDICERGAAVSVKGHYYAAQSRSCVVLQAHAAPARGKRTHPAA
jgi:isoamylase